MNFKKINADYMVPELAEGKAKDAKCVSPNLKGYLIFLSPDMS